MTTKMNIALCLNSKYLMPSVVCIISILENNSGPIDFYLLYSYLTDDEIKFINDKIATYGSQYSLITIKVSDDVFNAGPINGRSREAYFRLLLPYVLPEDVSRCLYLDGDTIVQGALNEFYETDFESKALLVCEDVGELLFYHKERHKVLKIPNNYRYFNSGVLMFNLDYFRDNKIELEMISDFIIKERDNLKFLDQDVLNALFYDKVKLVPSYKYDYLEILVSQLLDNDNMDKAIIVHFLKKPWRYNYNGINAKYWWKYGKKVYGMKYYKFLFANFFYRKLLSFILMFISINSLKRIKQILFRK